MTLPSKGKRLQAVVLRVYNHLVSFSVSHGMQEADSLAAEKASMEAPGISGGDILQLNVGGESFVVTRGTLTQVCASSANNQQTCHNLRRWVESEHVLISAGQRLSACVQIQRTLGGTASTGQSGPDFPGL